MAEATEMPFWGLTYVGSRNSVLHEFKIRQIHSRPRRVTSRRCGLCLDTCYYYVLSVMVQLMLWVSVCLHCWCIVPACINEFNWFLVLGLTQRATLYINRGTYPLIERDCPDMGYFTFRLQRFVLH